MLVRRVLQFCFGVERSCHDPDLVTKLTGVDDPPGWGLEGSRPLPRLIIRANGLGGSPPWARSCLSAFSLPDGMHAPFGPTYIDGTRWLALPVPTLSVLT